MVGLSEGHSTSVGPAGHSEPSGLPQAGGSACKTPAEAPSDSEVAQFLQGQASVFVRNFHSVRLVIIRPEIASEAVCALVALETALALRLS